MWPLTSTSREKLWKLVRSKHSLLKCPTFNQVCWLLSLKLVSWFYHMYVILKLPSLKNLWWINLCFDAFIISFYFDFKIEKYFFLDLFNTKWYWLIIEQYYFPWWFEHKGHSSTQWQPFMVLLMLLGVTCHFKTKGIGIKGGL